MGLLQRGGRRQHEVADAERRQRGEAAGHLGMIADDRLPAKAGAGGVAMRLVGELAGEHRLDQPEFRRTPLPQRQRVEPLDQVAQRSPAGRRRTGARRRRAERTNASSLSPCRKTRKRTRLSGASKPPSCTSK